jgi:hypothetical protein
MTRIANLEIKQNGITVQKDTQSLDFGMGLSSTTTSGYGSVVGTENVVFDYGNQTIEGTKSFSSTIYGDIAGNSESVTGGVYTSGNQTIGGVKTFSSTIQGNISGNAGSVTNGVYTSGNQTIGGVKTFSTVAITSGPTLNSNGLDMNYEHISDARNISFRNSAAVYVPGTSDVLHLGVGSTANYNYGAFLDLRGKNTSGDARLGAGGSGSVLIYAGNVGSSNGLRWLFTKNGQLYNTNAGSSHNYLTVYATNGSYASRIQELICSRGPTDTFYHLATTSNGDIQHILSGAGNMFIDGSVIQNQPDYAEFFETTDFQAIEPGNVVVLEGDKVRVYNSETDSEDDIIGVVRPNGKATAINHPLNWPGKYEKDVFGQYILDENGDRIITDEYDPDQEYIWRSDRDEWVMVGLVGRVEVLSTATKRSSWKKMKDISQDVELWFIK